MYQHLQERATRASAFAFSGAFLWIIAPFGALMAHGVIRDAHAFGLPVPRAAVVARRVGLIPVALPLIFGVVVVLVLAGMAVWTKLMGLT